MSGHMRITRDVCENTDVGSLPSLPPEWFSRSGEGPGALEGHGPQPVFTQRGGERWLGVRVSEEACVCARAMGGHVWPAPGSADRTCVHDNRQCYGRVRGSCLVAVKPPLLQMHSLNIYLLKYSTSLSVSSISTLSRSISLGRKTSSVKWKKRGKSDYKRNRSPGFT